MSKSIVVRGLSHSFGKFEVLRDVSFEVGEGEIFGFIGPNGAGKTTTIRALATLLLPDRGLIEIDGIDVSTRPEEVRRVIGYMADHAGVYERVTSREYLEFFRDAYSIDSAKVVDAVLELTDIGALSDRLVSTLSKGQKQRLQLARILLHDPKVLILDEPASDLDPRARIEIRNLLTELRKLGKTVLLSSHILTELADVCTSIGIIERGRMVVSGPISEIESRMRGAGEVSAELAQPVEPTETVQRIRLSLLEEADGDPARVETLLAEAPGVSDVEFQAGIFVVSLRPGDREVAQLISHLVKNEVGVIGVEREKADLEKLFLQATRGET